MTSEHVEELYGKFEKSVAKKEREKLKTSLENCDNEKYENLKQLELTRKSPVKDFVGLIGLVSTLFGFIFLIFNLLVYACVVSTNTDRIEFATKLSADMTEYAQVANDELAAAYSNGGQEWTTNYILSLGNAEYSYETLSGELDDFESAYKSFDTAIADAEKVYNTAVENATDDNEKDAALAELKTALNDAETGLIDGLNGLRVLDGQNLGDKYSAYKTALETYKIVLSNENSTEEQKTNAKNTFNESAAKKDFEALLKEMSEYLALAKSTVSTIDTFTAYKTAVTEYQQYISDKNGGKNPTVKNEPVLLVGIDDYFGKDGTTGAINEIKTLYSVYAAVDTEYETNLDKAPAESTLLWWNAPLSVEVNKLVVTPSDLKACQNDFILHLNLYKTVINGLPERMEDVINYYNTDGIYQYSVYNESNNFVTFSYFTCNLNTMKSVLGNTSFENNKSVLNETVENFKSFKYTANFNGEDYLTESYNDGLVSSANAVKEAINEFNVAVTGMTEVSSQANSLIKSANHTSDILSAIVMVYDIILAVILAAYTVALIFTYKSKAQRENIKAINKAINA